MTLPLCHKNEINCIFAHLLTASDFNVDMEKIIDEKIQGQTLSLEQRESNKRKLFIESYGCAMNFSDSEIVASILAKEGFNTTQKLEEADLVLVNTCSIRDKAEQTVRKRLEKYNAVKKINPTMKVGVLGCMAERLKAKFLEEEKIVDLVVGPDAYRDLPNLLEEVEAGRDAVNVILSKEETYGDVSPVRLNSNGVSAFVSITRGCDNMCTFCVVPFTRGRERSRDPKSIVEEIKQLVDSNYKEITLLGQNVDSYLWYGGGLKKDFKNASEIAQATAVDVSPFIDSVATAFPKEGGYDTLLHGKVVDMLHFPMWKGYLPEWIPFYGGKYFTFFEPVFNIADMSVTTGMILLLISSFINRPSKKLDNPH